MATLSSSATRDIYAEKALEQIPRLLSNQDRNPFSPTYGCFHRDYWLDKTSDFPDAVRQFAVHALALVYRNDFPGNVYQGRAQIRDWAIAGLDFWQAIQHRDGSFDEFYPNERGWVGPTAFTTLTSIEALSLLSDEIPAEAAERVRAAIGKAARCIAAGESEEDHLANHHAMACLAVWRAYQLLGEAELERGYHRLWQGFLSYHHREEGWSREYDGVDPGYLSATVSFLAKILRSQPPADVAEAIQGVLAPAIRFASHFVYPDGFYGGSLGSRNTLHFYPHGFELSAAEDPVAAAVALRLRRALAAGKLVPPAIISDRYVAYRVPEYLESFLDAAPATVPTAALPYEAQPFVRFFAASKVFVARTDRHYAVANMAKGGVVKIFDTSTGADSVDDSGADSVDDSSGRLVLNDCGLIGRMADGHVVTSQWIDPTYDVRADASGCRVSGRLQKVPSNKLFTPLRQIVFRLVLLAIGWHPRLAHLLKGGIRKTLILGQRPVGILFERRLAVRPAGFELIDDVRPEGRVEIEALSVGGEFFVRYVPQSRYFQFSELETQVIPLDGSALQALRQGLALRLRRTIGHGDGELEVAVLDDGARP